MKGAHKALIAACCTALGATAACQLIAGLGDRTVGVADSGAGDVNVCTSVGLAPPPADAASSPDDSVSIVAALEDVDFALDGGTTNVYGLNLDSTCTCPGPDSCVRPNEAGPACDVRDGIDIGGRALFQLASEFGVVSQLQLNQALQQGQSGVLIGVTQYNGTPNDSSVNVSVFTSLGIAEGTTPQFDGTDVWTVQDTSLFGMTLTPDGGYIAQTTTTGYVTNGTLVATFNVLPLTVGSSTDSPVTLALSNGSILAQITQTNSVYKLSGTLAGRWPINTMLTSFQAFIDPNSPTEHLCGTDTTYQLLKSVSCPLPDITDNPANDNRGSPCNALGIGLHFDAVSAQLGAVVSAASDAGAPCGATWTDMCP
jgi:hypothetical protein